MRDHKANLWCFGKKQTAKNELVTTRPAVPELGLGAIGCSGFLPMVDASEGDLAAKFWPDSIPWLTFSLPPFIFLFLAVFVSGSLANPDALLSCLGGMLNAHQYYIDQSNSAYCWLGNFNDFNLSPEVNLQNFTELGSIFWANLLWGCFSCHGRGLWSR